MKMRPFSYLAAGMILAAAAAAPAQAQVALSVGTPGFYGAIDLGDAPAPALVYQQPTIIQPAAVGVEPMYLYVPPAQYANWGSYCAMYGACDRPVYFVSRDWYSRVYVPHYRSHRAYYMGRRAEFDRVRGGHGFPERRGAIRPGGPGRIENRGMNNHAPALEHRNAVMTPRSAPHVNAPHVSAPQHHGGGEHHK